jgi:16S rRNA (guanine966-N2)-methyltransferase
VVPASLFVRVVAGVAGGRKLQAPVGRDIRPTSDRVREAVFSSLESMGAVRGVSVVDLFCGSGALGIEALSRGAASATFVDDDPAAVAAVRANLAATGLEGGEVVRSDAVRWLEGSAAFDLALVDPPYSFDGWDMVLTRLRAGLVVAESDRELEVPPGWRIVRLKRYGGTVVHLAASEERH